MYGTVAKAYGYLGKELDEHINLSEFLDKLWCIEYPGDAEILFKLIDSNADGLISLEDLQAALEVSPQEMKRRRNTVELNVDLTRLSASDPAVLEKVTGSPKRLSRHDRRSLQFEIQQFGRRRSTLDIEMQHMGGVLSKAERGCRRSKQEDLILRAAHKRRMTEQGSKEPEKVSAIFEETKMP